MNETTMFGLVLGLSIALVATIAVCIVTHNRSMRMTREYEKKYGVKLTK